MNNVVLYRCTVCGTTQEHTIVIGANQQEQPDGISGLWVCSGCGVDSAFSKPVKASDKEITSCCDKEHAD